MYTTWAFTVLYFIKCDTLVLSLEGFVKEMESHSICVGVSDHLPENIQLLGHFIDITCILLWELLQHVCGLGLGLILRPFITEIFSTNRRVKWFRAIGETVAVGADHIRGSLLQDIQVDTKGLHLIGVVLGTKRLQVIGERYLGSLVKCFSLSSVPSIIPGRHFPSCLLSWEHIWSCPCLYPTSCHFAPGNTYWSPFGWPYLCWMRSPGTKTYIHLNCSDPTIKR